MTYVSRKTCLVLALACTSLGLALFTLRALAADPDPEDTPSLVVYELQTGGCGTVDPSVACNEDPKDEFIELSNPGRDTLHADNWKVQYVSASGNTVTELTRITGTIKPHGRILLSHAGYRPEADLHFGSASDSGKLAKTGGYLQIRGNGDGITDLVAWGTAAQKDSWPLVPQIRPGYSIKRTRDIAPGEFTLATLPTSPEGGDLVTATPPVIPEPSLPPATPTTPVEQPPQPPPVTPEIPPAVPSEPPVTTPTDSYPPPVPTTPPDPVQPPATIPCASIRITELLPNPKGDDTSFEYIELHNVNAEAISLEGCYLQTSSSSKKYTFTSTGLNAGEYTTLTSSATGLTMPNTGGTVWLKTGEQILQTVTYDKTMTDDEAWAQFGDEWSETSLPTPGALNQQPDISPASAASTPTATAPEVEAGLTACKPGQERNPATNRCRTVIAELTETLVTCKAGQERNPETNRCRAVVSAVSTLTTCKTGETRNPATNRCIKAAAASVVTACKAGQERNPETNRCKAVASAAAQKACPTGQARNSATNRCKKIIGGAMQASVKDVKSDASGGGSANRWTLAGAALLVAFAYAIFEWRQELRRKLEPLLARFIRIRRPWAINALR